MSGAMNGRWIESEKGWNIYGWRPKEEPDAEPSYFTAGPAGTFNWTRFATIDEARGFVKGQPAIERVRVEFEVSLPPGIAYTQEQLVAWLEFSLGANGSLDGGNPFIHHEPEVVSGTFNVS